ncbi:cell division protein PerM [Kitasatospora sp. P5_F3]
MTQLMGRPILGLPGELGVRPFLADLLTGVRAALLTLAVVAVPVLALWVLTPYADDTAAGAGRLACALWLLGHGAPLTRGVAQAPLTLTPLLLTLFTVVLLVRTGRRLGGRERLHWRAPLAVCAGYLSVALGAVAECSGAGALRAVPLLDLVAVAVLVAGSVGAGLWSAVGGWSARPGRWLDRAPDWARAPAWARTPGWARVPGWARPTGGGPVTGRAAAAGGFGLLAAGGVVLAVTVLLGLGAAGRSAAGYGGGPSTVGGLTLACLLLVPNAVLWAASYALGPGFAVGSGTVVAPTGARVGPVPDFPLFALLPETGGAPWWPVVCALPLLAGLVPALLLGRAAAEARWHPVAIAASAVGSSLLAGLGAGACAWLAGGALADARMAELGPVPWLVAPMAAAWLALVTVPGALLARWWVAPPAWWIDLTGRQFCRARRAAGQGLTWAADHLPPRRTDT